MQLEPGKHLRTQSIVQKRASSRAAPVTGPSPAGDASASVRSTSAWFSDPVMHAAHGLPSPDAVQRLSPGGGPDPGAVHDAAEHGISGPSGVLPHLDRIQSSFGRHDLTGVQAHVGGAASEGSEAMGAQAFATGSHVAFAAQPDLHTAAHEAAHVVQQRGGVQLSGGVGSVGDAYEQHADQVADAVVRGESAEGLLDSMSGSGSGVQRKAVQKRGEPGSDTAPTAMTNSAGNSLQHAEPTLGMGRQVDAQGAESRPPGDADAAVTAGRRNVQIVADSANRVVTRPGQAPDVSALFTEGEGGTAVTATQGDVASPNVRTSMVEDCLYIGGGPSSADVRQGGIGDCYFEAVLLGIVAQDPGKITGMMGLSGGNVTVSFFRLNTATGDWVSVSIANNNHLQVRVDGSGNPTNRLKGAGFRVADDPALSQWWAAIDGGTLEVFREDKYEAALWAPLMEKSYADFAQQFGKYGRGLSASETGQGGYDILDSGGGSQACYPMFYGDAVTDTDTQAVNFTPGNDIVADNIPALQRLIRFENNKQNPGAAGGEQEFIQARIGTDGAISRCKAMARAVLDHQATGLESAGLAFLAPVTDFLGITDQAGTESARAASGADTLATALEALITKIDTYQGNSTTANRQSVVTDARTIQTPGTHPLLSAPNTDHVYRNLNENLGIVINLGTDNGPGRRMVYAAHAYNIYEVNLCDSSGAALDIPADQVAARASDIDPERSTVVMENPHARNEPDLDGTGPADGVNEGRFTLSLASLFRNIDLLRLATVEHEAQLGDFPEPSGDVAYA